jgi:UDP-N-acetylglucosamine--N-acetylmuramyl-(pentapeptide) pyrophosphoryl-undecaprenol N-acetylglucosamine transferase
VLPLPSAASDHQRKNADVFDAAGACRTIDERELEGRLDNCLSQAFVELASDHPQRVRMAQAMAGLARPRATRRVARSIRALVESRKLAVA